MPRLSSRSKHEEFELNSTLQIRIRRKEGAEAEKEEKQRKKRSREFRTTVRKFRTIMRKFRTGAKFPSCATVHAAFDILTFLCPFLISSHFSLDV